MVQINDYFYEDLNEDSIVKIIEDIQKGSKPKPGPQSKRTGSEPHNNRVKV